jgi:hypothetical protein
MQATGRLRTSPCGMDHFPPVEDQPSALRQTIRKWRMFRDYWRDIDNLNYVFASPGQ